MTTEGRKQPERDALEAAARAIGKILADEVGGCFNEDEDPQGECADGDCYCVRKTRILASAAISAFVEVARDEESIEGLANALMARGVPNGAKEGDTLLTIYARRAVQHMFDAADGGAK